MSGAPSQEQTKTAPPYIAFQSLKTLCGTMKDHGVPGRIDRSVLGNFSGAVGGQIMTALKFLSLTDSDSHPTATMRHLVASYNTDEWAPALEGVIRHAYQPIFSLDLETASPAQFNEKFRTAFPAKDETLRKCQAFFINAVRDAGIKTSAYLMKNKKPRSGPPKKRSPAAPRAESQAPPNKEKPAENKPPGGSTKTPNAEIQKMLLEKFPAFDPSWSSDIQGKWFDAYDRLLNGGEK